MTHDIDDIHIALIEEHLDYALRMIKRLEERIISLETVIENNKSMRMIQGLDDSYYWEHG